MTPRYSGRVEVMRGRGKRYLRGQELRYPRVNGYQAYALEQFANDGKPQYSARVDAPADVITPYVWICAWYSAESWAEAVMAAQEFDHRIRAGESFGEHELVRRADV